MLARVRLLWSNLPLRRKGLIVVGLPIVTLLIAGIFTVRMLEQSRTAQQLVNQSRQIQVELQDLRTTLIDADAGVRGYLLTGKEDFLNLFYEAETTLPQIFETVQTLLHNDAEQLERLQQAESQIAQEFAALRQLLNYAQILERDPELIEGFIVTSQVVSDSFSAQLDLMVDRQEELLVLRETEQTRSARNVFIASTLNIMFGVLGGLLAIQLFSSGITQRIRQLIQTTDHLAQSGTIVEIRKNRDEIGQLEHTLHETSKLLQNRQYALQQAHQETRKQLEQVNLRNQQISLLNDLGHRLHEAKTLSDILDAVETIRHQADALYPMNTGSLYLFDEDTQMYQRTLVWGDVSTQPESIHWKDCCACDEGIRYDYNTEAEIGCCDHFQDAIAPMHFCCTLVAQEQKVGIFSITGQQPFTESGQRTFQATADLIALAVANLKLRESLTKQALHDPLTGLHNRRFLEVELERERHRAKRNDSPFSILAIDIDHFKRINDRYGHDVGDMVLKAFGALLQNSFRKQDIVCRYGGEEFLVVMPDSTLEDSRARAEALSKAVRQLRIPVKGQEAELEMISVSIGVSSFPKHGTESRDLIRNADLALYRAKDLGRNRIVLADHSTIKDEFASTPSQESDLRLS